MSINLIGQTLLNQFRIDAFIASGGMGAVYRVWDLKRNVPLAMKVLHSDMAEDSSAFKRFKREANALKKLAHPNIVPFYGIYQTSDFTFLLERYVDGPSLKDILRERHGKAMTVNEVLVYLKALSAALGYAHANGVVHCDVKPGNVLIDQGGNIYLTDFGIARHTESTTTTLATVGTTAYMAPEQIRGESVSPATDIYALGVMIYEMLTGQKLFRGDEKGTESAGMTVGERIRYAHLILPPPNPRVINPALNEGLTQVIMKALEKEANQRYQSTHEMFIAAFHAVNIHPELLADQTTSQTKLDFIPGDVNDGKNNGNRQKRRGLIPAILIIFGVVAIAAIYLVGSGITKRQPSEVSLFTSTSYYPTHIPTNLVYSATPEIAQYTNTFQPVTDTPIPLPGKPVTLDPSDPQSVFSWVKYAIENDELEVFNQFILTDEIIYVNYLEGGQTVSIYEFMNDLEQRVSSHPTCQGLYLDDYYYQIWFSNWAPGWEMTELCYDGCNSIDPPWTSNTAAFFFERVAGKYHLSKMYLNDPYHYFFQNNIPLAACDLGSNHFSTATRISSCPGSPTQRLYVGGRGQVCTKSDDVMLRIRPGRGSSLIAQLPKGTSFTVIGGPECGGNNWSWWQVRTNSGQTGWIAEGGDQIDPYFLCPLP